jgi:hypothetical protein
MAAGPETNLWKSMQRNLPQGCVATRLENRHGGGIPDVMLMWDGVIKQVFDPAAPSLSELPKLIDKNYQSSSLKSTDFCGRIYSADILRPEQKAFAARACSCGAPVFILARPQKSNEIKLLSPVITNAALRLRAVAESPRWPEIFAALRLAAVRGP